MYLNREECFLTKRRDEELVKLEKLENSKPKLREFRAKISSLSTETTWVVDVADSSHSN